MFAIMGLRGLDSDRLSLFFHKFQLIIYKNNRLTLKNFLKNNLFIDKNLSKKILVISL